MMRTVSSSIKLESERQRCSKNLTQSLDNSCADLYSASNKGKTKAGETSAVVRVRRLLTAQDITGALVKREVFVRWPEDKHWYQAVLTKVPGRNKTNKYLSMKHASALSKSCRRCG